MTRRARWLDAETYLNGTEPELDLPKILDAGIIDNDDGD